MMVFSTHRFRNLTEYADIIVYALSKSQIGGCPLTILPFRYMNDPKRDHGRGE